MRNDRIMATRAALDKARKAHMLALQSAIAAGTSMDELHHDTDAFVSAARQLLYVCGVPSNQAPMVLAVVG